MDIVWVTSAEYLHDYVVRITFNDGSCGDIDLHDFIMQHNTLFGELIDKEKFKRFKLNGWTLSWLDGKLDIAPESLYYRIESKGKNKPANKISTTKHFALQA